VTLVAVNVQSLSRPPDRPEFRQVVSLGNDELFRREGSPAGQAKTPSSSGNPVLPLRVGCRCTGQVLPVSCLCFPSARQVDSPATGNSTRHDSAYSRAMDKPVATAQDTVDWMVGKSQRVKGVQIRNGFVQAGRGRGSSPGKLHLLVRHHDERGLDLYLLARLLALGQEPYEVDLHSAVWSRAMGLGSEETSARIARIWLRLERLQLTQRAGRKNRNTKVRILDEVDPSQPYTPPATDYFTLPVAYFKEGWCFTLTLAEKAVLLIALYQAKPTFELLMDRVAQWYGISAETLDKGARGLERHHLLTRARSYRKAPESPTGYAEVIQYTLAGPFAKAKRRSEETPGDGQPSPTTGRIAIVK
jgi:hypothetical protein